MVERNNPEGPDFSALHEQGNVQGARHTSDQAPGGDPFFDGSNQSGEEPRYASPTPEPEESGWPHGLTRALSIAAVMVGISSLIMAGSAVVYVSKHKDSDEKLAQLVAAASSEPGGSSHHGKTSNGKSGKSHTASSAAKGHGGSASGDSASGGGDGKANGEGAKGAAGGAAAAGGGGVAAVDDEEIDENADVENVEENDADEENNAVEADDQDSEDSQSSGPEWINGILMLRMDEPTVDDFAAQFRYLIDPNVSDAGIKANVDAGVVSVPAVRFMQKTIELNRSNNWQWHFHGPVEVDGDTATVFFENSANGYPNSERKLIFNKIDGNWRYSRQTVCSMLAAEGGGGPQCM